MIGVRLRQARLANGLSLGEVVERLAASGQPLTRAGLSKYELNKSTPSADVLLRLGQVLGVRPDFFMVESKVTIDWVAYRKHSTLRRSRQKQIEAFVGKRVEDQLWLRGILYPDRHPLFPAPYTARTPEDAESAAKALRDKWALDLLPIESVTQTVEDHGGIVVGWPSDEGKFDGLAGWANGTVPVMVINSSVATDRQRFDLAHELGHMVMDCQGSDTADAERLAHRFAAAFLVPRASAIRELGDKRRHLSLDELELLKRKYGLSMQSWARRARDLEIIEEGQYRALCVQFSARGWRKQEPVAFPGIEEPIVFKQMTLRAVAEEIISRDHATQLCAETVKGETTERAPQERLYLSAVELMRLPVKERERILTTAAAEAEASYRCDPDLTDFHAYGEEDLYDATP